MLSSYRSVSSPLGAMAEGYPSAAEVESTEAKRACCPAMRVIVAIAPSWYRSPRPARRASGSDTPIVVDAGARLDALGERWMTARPRSRTARPNASLERQRPRISVCASSSETVGVHSDVQTGLRICSGVGEMRLAWDPPDRWRMDEVSPDGRLHTALYPRWRRSLSGDRGCQRPPVLRHRDERTVRVGGRSPRALTADRACGSVVTAGPRRTIAGIPAECFTVRSEVRPETIHRWSGAYSPDGLLLYLIDGVEGGRVTTAEATDVSRGRVRRRLRACRPPE